MQFTKTHKTYTQQIDLMRSRGMEITDEAQAVAALKRIGYYRLSAYTYPMREPLSDEGREPLGPRRSDQFVEGSRLADAVALHDFDQRLRRCLLAAAQTLEVGLRTKVAYHLSKHGAMAHLTQDALDSGECCKLVRGPDNDGTKFELWREEYNSLQRKAKEEDYVKHFLLKYDGNVPIWAAGEFMTMGCLIQLYKLMCSVDTRRIANEFGVKSQDVLFGWLKALNVLRNNCAHNARIWNRNTVYPPDHINMRMVERELYHLANADTNKLYFLAAVLEYLVRHVDKRTRFPSEFRTTMKKFPAPLGMTPQNTMGFMVDWGEQALWKV